MNTTDFELNGKSFHLAMNGYALFDLYEKFGTKKNALELIEGNDKQTFTTMCWMLFKFAEQGELVRRYQGYNREIIPTEEFFKVNMKALDVPRAKIALKQTIVEGFRREEEDHKPVDLLLLENEKKTENP